MLEEIRGMLEIAATVARSTSRLLLCLQAALLLLGDTFALLGMHAESQLEVAENKGEERREGNVNFVKLR